MNNGRTVVGQEARSLDGSSTECDHGQLRTRQCLPDEPGLDLAERRLALRREELRDRAVLVGDGLVDVDERPSEPLRHVCADRRLPRAHEPDEDDVPAQLLRDVQSIRST
jgi:hypothetical protein